MTKGCPAAHPKSFSNENFFKLLIAPTEVLSYYEVLTFCSISIRPLRLDNITANAIK